MRENPHFHEKLLNFYERCSSFLYQDIKAITLYLKSKSNNQMVNEKYFSSYFPKEKMDKIKEIMKIKRDTLTLKKPKIIPIIELLDKNLKIGDQEEIFFLSKKLIEHHLDSSQKGIINQLVEMALAIKVGNTFWMKREILSLLNKDKRKLIFEIQCKNFRTQQECFKFEEKIVKIIRFVEGSLTDYDLRRKFLTFWSNVLLDHGMEEIDLEEQTNWSLIELRQSTESQHSKNQLTSFWFPLYFKRASFQEISKFLALNFSYHSLKQDLGSFGNLGNKMWMTKYFFPEDRPSRELIEKEVNRYFNSSDWYEQYILLEALSNRSLKQYMGEKENFFNRPLDQWKRDFYQKLLRSGLATEFAVYNLLKLREKDPLLLWWLAI